LRQQKKAFGFISRSPVLSRTNTWSEGIRTLLVLALLESASEEQDMLEYARQKNFSAEVESESRK